MALDDLKTVVARRNILDGRSILDPDLWRAAGWNYRALGVATPTRGALVPTWAAPTWTAGTWAWEAETRAAPITAAEESAANVCMGNLLVLLALCELVDSRPRARSWSGLPDMGHV